MHRYRLPALVLATTLVLSGLPAPAAVAAPAGTAGAVAAAAPTSVTLITGDRVTLHGRNASVQPGPGRAKVPFMSQTLDGHRFVIPHDALALLRAGKLDRRLFDVTELAALGAGKELPLLVTYPKGGSPAARTAVAAGDARVTRDIPAVNTLAVRADVAVRASIWSALTAGTSTARTLRAEVQKVWLDGRRKVSLDHSVPQIGAPAAWQAGFDGTGVTVAVLDTGIDTTHPDLAGQVAASENFTEAADADDKVGHGTHVASTIAGTGAASDGRYKGVAPGAKLLNGKVCEDEYCDDSAILAGMVWGAEHAKVVSMSLGGGNTPDVDPLEQAVQDLTAQYDTLFVIAAGNAGGTGTVSSPSTADAALSVGAVDRDDQLAPFSSGGPRAGDSALKPEITAPGVDIVAAKAANGYIGDAAPVDGYTSLSGTSMATPHVAGAAALLTQQHPDWSSPLRKHTLMASAQPTEGVNAFQQGAGRVDVARAITQTVTTDEGALSFGLQQWPHGDDQPVTKTVTYRNSGTAAVELTLAAPGAPFTLADTTLTVPAGGTASTTVTADTSDDSLPDEPLGSILTATGAGGVRVETPLGVDKEVESYDYTVKTINRDGSPNSDHLVVIFDLDDYRTYDLFNGDTEKVRIAKGRYGVFAWVFQGDEEASMLTDSELVVDKAGELVVDARDAKPVRVTPPQEGTGTTLAVINSDWVLENVGYFVSLGMPTFDSLYAGRLSEVSKPFVLASVNGSFAAPGADGGFRNSPYIYDLAYSSPGRMFDGLQKAPRRSELATIRANYATEATGVEGAKGNSARFTADSGGWTVFIPFDLPFQRTEYVNTEADWSGDFVQQIPPAGEDSWPEFVSEAISGAKTYRAGRTYGQEWNRAVFGPNVTQPSGPFGWASRWGDNLAAYVPLFGEGTGNPGWSSVESETVSLYRGDTKVGDGNEYELPPETATYRLEASAKRGAPHLLSTEVSASWTFESGHVEGDEFQRLPLSTVRFGPRLDAGNAAPKGVRYQIPVTVEHHPESGAGTARTVRVEVSYDDGKTWQRAELSGSGDNRTATVRHPQNASFVSLRASAADRAGNTVTQTVIRAYVLR